MKVTKIETPEFEAELVEAKSGSWLEMWSEDRQVTIPVEAGITAAQIAELAKIHNII